jgi:hypothetical protein
MVEVTDPRLGETVLDPASGTGGFLVEAYNHLSKQVKTVADRKTLQNPEREYELLMFPVSQVFDWDKWQDGFDVHWSGFPRIKSSAKTLVERWMSISLPVFEKVNTGGKALDAFELVTVWRNVFALATAGRGARPGCVASLRKASRSARCCASFMPGNVIVFPGMKFAGSLSQSSI